MTDRRHIADELWAAFKGWEGERKLRFDRSRNILPGETT